MVLGKRKEELVDVEGWRRGTPYKAFLISSFDERLKVEGAVPLT